MSKPDRTAEIHTGHRVTSVTWNKGAMHCTVMIS